MMATANADEDSLGPLTKIKVKLNGRTMEALIDTGENVSVMRFDVIMPNEYDNIILPEEDNTTVGVNCETIAFKGRLKCQLSYKGVTIDASINIAKEINFPVLIGTDLLPKLIPQGILDLSTMRLVHRSGVPYEIPFDVRAKQEIIIPRRSNVYVCVDSPIKVHGEVMYELYENFEKGKPRA